jgi:predicted butyrate kinase (DUF1464 family)
MAAELWETVG